MTEHHSYWLITKVANGFAKQEVKERIRIHFDGTQTRVMLGESGEGIIVLGLYRDEEEPTYHPSPIIHESGEWFTYTFIDLSGGRIFSVSDERHVDDILLTLLATVAIEKLKGSGLSR